MSNESPSMIVRAIWFVFVGWWLTGFLLGVAWFLNLTIVAAPIGIKIINKVPKALSLKAMGGGEDDEFAVGTGSNGNSPGLIVRGVYFVFIGWWASLFWMAAAYLLTLSIIGIPFAIMMYNKLPYVVSLYRA